MNWKENRQWANTVSKLFILNKQIFHPLYLRLMILIEVKYCVYPNFIPSSTTDFIVVLISSLTKRWEVKSVLGVTVLDAAVPAFCVSVCDWTSCFGLPHKGVLTDAHLLGGIRSLGLVEPNSDYCENNLRIEFNLIIKIPFWQQQKNELFIFLAFTK